MLRLAAIYVRVGTTWWNLQCKLRPVATLCLAWSCLARGRRHGQANCCFFGICGPLKDFGKVSSMSPGRLLVWKSHWKRFQPSVWVVWGQVSGNHQHKVNKLAQIWSQLEPASLVGGKFDKVIMMPASTSVPEESCPNPCLSSLHAKVNQFSSSLYLCLWCFSSCCLWTEA